MRGKFELEGYSDIIRGDWQDSDRYRLLIHQLPRRFHNASRERQAAALLAPPTLTGTRWDALLAAVVEHLAWLHDHPIPAWINEPERFLQTPWVIPRNAVTAADAVLYAPGAFIRHGALPDPLDLDARGGEKVAWRP